MKRIILLSDGIFHPPVLARGLLKRQFRHLGYEVTSLSSFEQLLDLELESYAACVVYLHHQTISPMALAAFDSFVHGGGGVLGIHTATAAFKDTPHYAEIMGARFTGHGPVSTFEVTPVPGPNEPFDGLLAFDVTDELYLHEFQQGVRVHFTAEHAGMPQPVVWTYYYGAGKVCCAAPGHFFLTVQNEIYQEVLFRGLAWVSN